MLPGPPRRAGLVNGQVTVPAGGQEKVPTPRVDQVLFRVVPFIRGAWTAVRKILAPTAWKTASNEVVKFDLRSRIRT